MLGLDRFPAQLCYGSVGLHRPRWYDSKPPAVGEDRALDAELPDWLERKTCGIAEGGSVGRRDEGTVYDVSRSRLPSSSGPSTRAPPRVLKRHRAHSCRTCTAPASGLA